MPTTTLRLTELGCASCVMDIEGALEALPGITRAEVHAAREEVTVDHSPAVTPQAIAAALVAAGHPAEVREK